MLADAELVVSELVTNGVQHAGLSADDSVRVGAAVSDGVLRLEVDNPGATGTTAPRDPDPERGGFGLQIVEALADAWGVSRKGHTRVWVELACWPRPTPLRHELELRPAKSFRRRDGVAESRGGRRRSTKGGVGSGTRDL